MELKTQIRFISFIINSYKRFNIKCVQTTLKIIHLKGNSINICKFNILNQDDVIFCDLINSMRSKIFFFGVLTKKTDITLRGKTFSQVFTNFSAFQNFVLSITHHGMFKVLCSHQQNNVF